MWLNDAVYVFILSSMMKGIQLILTSYGFPIFDSYHKLPTFARCANVANARVVNYIAPLNCFPLWFSDYFRL